jgi:hypothetical protein
MVPRFKTLVHFMRYKQQWIRASRYFVDAERDDRFAAFASKNKKMCCFDLQKHQDAQPGGKSTRAEDWVEQKKTGTAQDAR